MIDDGGRIGRVGQLLHAPLEVEPAEVPLVSGRR